MPTSRTKQDGDGNANEGDGALSNNTTDTADVVIDETKKVRIIFNFQAEAKCD